MVHLPAERFLANGGNTRIVVPQLVERLGLELVRRGIGKRSLQIEAAGLNTAVRKDYQALPGRIAKPEITRQRDRPFCLHVGIHASTCNIFRAEPEFVAVSLSKREPVGIRGCLADIRIQFRRSKKRPRKRSDSVHLGRRLALI